MSKIYQNRGGTLTLVSDDDNAVHKTGDETIAGTKTFSSTITGSVSGNAGTATQFSANTTVALTGDATGTSAGSKKGWSVPVTLANSGVTAGSYGPSANATPGYGATFNVPYITVDAKGRVTAAATHTVKIPASDNADVKVTQTVSTDNAELPILTKASNATSTVTDTSKFAAAVKINPSTGTLTATKFVGPLTGNVTGNCSGSSGSCTGTAAKATGDADGNAIKTTYAKLASPALTGTPTAPTAAFGTNTTQIATTAFVYNNAAKHLAAATNIYVAKAASGNGSGSNTSNYMSLADLRNYLATVHMHSSTADLNGSYNLQLLFKAGESFGNATFDATKMPGVRNLILNTSTGTASTSSNYSTNSPTFGSITVTGDIAVTIRNINCTGKISAQWGAYVAIDTYVAASSFSAINNGYLNVAKNMTIDVCDAHTDYLFNASTNGIIAMWPGATITMNFRQQCYYTRALFASSGNGTMWLGYSSLKLTGTQPIAVWGGSGTLTGTSETAAGTAAKAVTLASGQTFTLTTNATAKVKFTIDNTAANPTLNINSTGAKPIFWNGAAVAANMLMKNITYDVKYDGTHFVIQNAVKRLTNNDFGIFRTSGYYNQTYNSGSWNFTGWSLSYGTGVENSNWRGNHIGNIQQNVTTSNKTFPILFSGTENATANTSTAPYFGSGVKINPSTSTISASTFSGNLTGNVTGNVTGNCSGSSGSCTGNAATVTGTEGTSLLAWNTENTVYTVGGHAIKVKLPANPNSNWTSHLYAGASNGNANAATTNGNTYLIICDNTTARDRRLIKGTGATTVTSDANGVITINSTDNNTTYANFVKSGSGAKAGLVPAPSTTAGTTKYLREDCTWQVPPDNNTTYANFVKSGSGAKNGLVPAPSTTAGTTKYLREDCTWQVPPDTKYTHPTTSGNKHIPSGGSSGQILRWSADGTAAWGADNNTTYSDATTSAHGLMTAADKTKLNGIATSAGKYTLVATWQTSGDKTITGCTVGQLILFLYSMGKSDYNPQETDTGCWIKVVSGAVAGTSASGGHFWLGTATDIERRSTNIFATVATATSVKVNVVDVGDDATKDTLYVYR